MGRQAARAGQPQGGLPNPLTLPISDAPRTAERTMADEIAILAGGCFWCTEAVFLDVVGVKTVESGYTGGVLTYTAFNEMSRRADAPADPRRDIPYTTELSYEDPGN